MPIFNTFVDYVQVCALLCLYGKRKIELLQHKNIGSLPSRAFKFTFIHHASFTYVTFNFIIVVMKQKIVHVAIVVDDYDEAIEFYTQRLHFTLLEDTVLSDTKRWVLVAPKGSGECCLLLAKATTEEQKSRVGNQTGGRVFLFLHTDDLQRDYQNLVDKKIKIIREPTVEEWGKVAVFEDLYGNLWDLIEPQGESNRS